MRPSGHCRVRFYRQNSHPLLASTGPRQKIKNALAAAWLHSARDLPQHQRSSASGDSVARSISERDSHRAKRRTIYIFTNGPYCCVRRRFVLPKAMPADNMWSPGAPLVWGLPYSWLRSLRRSHRRTHSSTWSYVPSSAARVRNSGLATGANIRRHVRVSLPLAQRQERG